MTGVYQLPLPQGDEILPLHLDVPAALLDDLRERLARTRWPERETDASQGVSLAVAREVCAYWAHQYDWRRCEGMLNGLGQYRTTIDGLGIHFLHIRSPVPDALPLLLTHGWPGSVIEFHKVFAPLTDPAWHGGRAADAFHVITPSLPGFGFSDRPAGPGWGLERIARAWIVLMRRLGYEKFVAQGGDWGAGVTTEIAMLAPPELRAIHLNQVLTSPAPEDMADITPAEQAALATEKRYRKEGNAYARQQMTRPQTLGYGLTDSPAGQAMWIYEKFAEWADCDGDPRNVLSLDEMLDNIMLYWLPGNAAASARLYWESLWSFTARRVDVPVGCSIFPREIFRSSRRWAARRFPQLIHWRELDKGGHFAAFEQPAMFVDELRDAFRTLR